MENKSIKSNFSGPGWNHFRAKELHINKQRSSKNTIHPKKIDEKNNKNFYSWMMDTLNPINHIPIVSSVKKIITKSNKSLDIVQAAVGGFLFAGPLGIIKGIGSWAANRITDNLISKNPANITNFKKLSNNVNKDKKNTNNENIKNNTNSQLKTIALTENKKKIAFTKNEHLINYNINSHDIKVKGKAGNQLFKNYSEKNYPQSNINISA